MSYLCAKMALVTLRNGKVIDVDIVWYLSLSDEEYNELIASDAGFETDNPFHGSSLSSFRSLDDDVDDSVDIGERDDI